MAVWLCEFESRRPHQEMNSYLLSKRPLIIQLNNQGPFALDNWSLTENPFSKVIDVALAVNVIPNGIHVVWREIEKL